MHTADYRSSFASSPLHPLLLRPPCPVRAQCLPKSPDATLTHPTEYGTRIIGAPNTLEHRTFLEQNGNVISPFHDVPLFADQNNGIFNMIVEVPRWTNAKMETSKEEAFNPIKQDIKKGRLRYVRNCFPHHGYIWNYGMFPQVRRASDTRFPRPDRPSQTWEDPSALHPETKAKGDNDPLDVCEIGEQVGYVGQVKQVKVLGIMALIDEGETDWKVGAAPRASLHTLI